MTVSTRPVFVEAETYNDAPALAQLARKLAKWASFSYERDLVYTPADPKVVKPGADSSDTSGAWDGSLGFGAMPVHTAVATNADGEQVASFPVPDSLSPARVVDLRFYVERSATTAAGRIEVVVGSTGQVYSVDVSGDTIGADATNGWLFLDVYLPSGPDTCTVTIYATTGTVSLLSLSGWFRDTTFGRSALLLASDGKFAPVALDYAAAGRPLSTHFLHRLVQNANLYTVAHPRPIVNKWLGSWAVSNDLDDLGAYRVQLSPHATEITVKMLVKSSGAGARTVTCRMWEDPDRTNPSAGHAATIGLASIDVSGYSAYTWVTATFAVPNGAARTCSITLLGAAMTGKVFVASVAAWESALSPPLASGDAVPAAFPSAIEEPTSGRPILADTWTAIAQAQAYLFAKRGRQLVCDCRHTGVGWTDVNDGNFDTLATPTDSLAVHRTLGRRYVLGSDRAGVAKRFAILASADDGFWTQDEQSTAGALTQYLVWRQTNGGDPGSMHEGGDYEQAVSAPGVVVPELRWEQARPAKAVTGVFVAGGAEEKVGIYGRWTSATGGRWFPALVYDLGAVFYEAS